MPRDLVQEFLNDPIKLAIGLGAVVLLVALVVVTAVRSSRRRRAKREREQAELVAMEREAQMSAAAERLPATTDPVEVSRQVASLFNSYLSMPVIALYAANDSGDRLSNLLPPQSSGTGPLAILPPSLPPTVLGEYRNARVCSLSVFLGGRTGELSMPGNAPGPNVRKVAVFPWRGHFGWSGLVVLRAGGDIGEESLARCSDALIHVASRLSTALELDAKRLNVLAAYRVGTRLVAFSRSLIRTSGRPSIGPGLLRDVADLLGSNSAALWRVDGEAKMVTMWAQDGLRSADFLPIPIGQGLNGRVAETSEPVSAIDAPSDPRCLFPSETRESGIGSYLGVPVNSEGHTLAVLEVHTTNPHAWAEADVLTLKSASDLIAEVIRLEAESQSSLRVESAYFGLSEALQRLRSREEILQAAVEVLGHALGVSRALIVEIERGDGLQVKPIRYEYVEPGFESALGMEIAPEFVQQVVSQLAGNRSVVTTGPLLPPEQVERFQIRSEVAVPIDLENRLHAIIHLQQCNEPRTWRADDLEFAHRVGKQLTLSLENVVALEAAVSEGKAAAREAEVAQEQVRQTAEVNARAVGLIDSLPEPVVGLDQQGRVTFFNSAARNILGLGNEDLGLMAEMCEALSVADEMLWDQVCACETLRRFQTLATSPTAASQNIFHSGPTPLPVSVAVSPVRNDQGQVTARIVLLTDIKHVGAASSHEISASIAGLEQRLGEVERALIEARAEEHRSRTLAEQARTAEAAARASAESALRAAADVRLERDQIREDEARTRRSAQQLLDINRLKSEFIVKAGRELETALNSLLGSAELLEQGELGLLSPDQVEAVRGICAWARNMQGDVAWMIEYSSSRSPRADATEAPQENRQDTPVAE